MTDFNPLGDILDGLKRADLVAKHTEDMKECEECGLLIPKDELVYNEDLWDKGICDKCASEHSETEYEDVWGDTDPREEK